MYKVKNNIHKGKITNDIDFKNLDGFVMPSRKKYFMIDGEKITGIKIVQNDLIGSIVSKTVSKKYKKLVKEITELLVDDDESEGSMNEVLNRINKFRNEIKNKYLSYLGKDELQKMNKKLRILEKEAKSRLEEMIAYNLFDENINTRSR
jgi:predicted nuclease with TOPRIM domain